MKKFLVIGNPIEHSLSPKLHNYWIKKNNLDAIYGKLETYDNDLSELCKSIKKGDLDGLNVTVPFKKSIIPLDNLEVIVSEGCGVKSSNSGKKGSISLLSNHIELHLTHPSNSIDDSIVATCPLAMSPSHVGHLYPAFTPLKIPFFILLIT